MRVFVYFNLHKKCWSVRDVKTGRVAYHTDLIVLKNCTFKVSAKGRERVLREQKKNVHAGVEGEVVDIQAIDTFWKTVKKGWVKTAKYNPYKYESFVTGVYHDPIYEADLVKMEALPKPDVTAYILDKEDGDEKV